MTAKATGKHAAVKRLAFRVLAVALGLLPLVAAEAALRLSSWGRPSEAEDPYVGFTAIRPLFVLDASGRRYEVDPARHAYFRPDGFAAEKAPGEFRVFCLGGSTVQGRPYAIETSFTTWLELSLQAAAPDRDWEVVNCGGVSYASYRLVPILRELLEHDPDLFIIYTGHNEFLEDRTYRVVKETPSLVGYLHGVCSTLRTYNVLRSSWLRATGRSRPHGPPPQNQLATEVDALLDYWGGLDDYHRNDAWKQGAVEHYVLNLQRMISLARGAGVPVLLVNPVSNLRDCPPFKFATDEALSGDERARFDELWTAAISYEGDDLQEQIELVQRVLALDDRHAGAQFLLGKCYERVGGLEAAKAALLRAKDEDICPLRMIEPLHAALAETARATGTSLVDARRLFEERSEGGIPGNRWLLDHIHPSINGHQLIAEALLDEMARMRLVRRSAGWEQRRERSYAAHLESLDAIYFARGQQRLEGLMAWTQGRAEKLKPAGSAAAPPPPE